MHCKRLLQDKQSRLFEWLMNWCFGLMNCASETNKQANNRQHHTNHQRTRSLVIIQAKRTTRSRSSATKAKQAQSCLAIITRPQAVIIMN
jgi:hypothetical protein